MSPMPRCGTTSRTCLVSRSLKPFANHPLVEVHDPKGRRDKGEHRVFRDRPANADYRLTGKRIMTTSKSQKLLLRFLVLLAICPSVSLWPAIPQRDVISKQLGLIVPVAAQAPVTLDRSIRDYKLPSEIPWVQRNGTGSLTLYGDASKPGGIYVSLLRRPFDNWSTPHTHPTERYGTVLEGTFLAGTGAVQDRNRGDALGVGTVG